jgi:hypothetical protein
MTFLRSHIRSILGSLAVLALLGALIPLAASAQFSNYCNNGYAYGNYNCTTTPGTLQVYVQVTNDYSTYNGYNEQPSDFTVTVSGQNPSPNSFPGSLSGVAVSVAGSYSVLANTLSGYTPTYSTGCNGTLVNGEQATCVITESNTTSYNNYPTPYPYSYPYPNSTLTCEPQNQTVGLGQSVTFTAEGNTSGPYNWVTPDNTFLSIGPTLTTTLNTAGEQTISVQNNSQSATCTVDVVAGYYPPSTVNTIYPNNVVNPTPNIPVYVTPTYVPHLPNTGFAPQTASDTAFAVLALLIVAAVTFPYVRKAFAIVLS